MLSRHDAVNPIIEPSAVKKIPLPLPVGSFVDLPEVFLYAQTNRTTTKVGLLAQSLIGLSLTVNLNPGPHDERSF